MSTASPPESASGAALGYGIAIAVSILVLISTIMLASYVCVRVKAGGSDDRGRGRGRGNHDGGGIADRVLPTTTTGGGGHSSEPIVIVLGLEKSLIDSYPKMVLGQSRRLPRPNSGPCSICLSDYREKDTIRCIPECDHCFHLDCIDPWLQISATCPVCRNSPSGGPTPVATPLSELVPLAFHAR